MIPIKIVWQNLRELKHRPSNRNQIYLFFYLYVCFVSENWWFSQKTYIWEGELTIYPLFKQVVPGGMLIIVQISNHNSGHKQEFMAWEEVIMFIGIDESCWYSPSYAETRGLKNGSNLIWTTRTHRKMSKYA